MAPYITRDSPEPKRLPERAVKSGRLSAGNWEFLRVNYPDIVLTMIRNQAMFDFFIDTQWLQQNVVGLYYVEKNESRFSMTDDNRIFFEKDEDLALFILTHQS